ncbi:hypothetical protein P692DRAFT_20882617 [Suillus brevipes Sb2]|nr:hypothetical protein P692DRAFT_20882617 [Suillus brevipes Sb2]
MLTEDVTHWQTLESKHREEMQSRILAVASGTSSLEHIVQLSSAAVIIFEHSFYINDKGLHIRHIRDQQKSYSFALELYMASPHAAAVRETVRAAVQAYEEAMRAPVHTYKGNLPAWMAKLLFERSEEKKMTKESMAKAGLIKTVLEITLEHRLPRP